MNLFPIPPSDMLKVKGMRKSDAMLWLQVTHPNITQEDREQVLNLARPDAQPVDTGPPPDGIKVIDPKRRSFAAAAWYVGASMSQLAALFGVARQTAQQMVNRCAPAHIRANQARIHNAIGYSQLAHIHNYWLTNRTSLTADPYALALELNNWLAANPAED